MDAGGASSGPPPSDDPSNPGSDQKQEGKSPPARRSGATSSSGNAATQYQSDASYIILKDSTFENLNYGQQVHALSSSDSTLNPFGTNQGIILNLNQFNGQVEIIGNRIKKNHVFIPSAIFSNYI